MSDDDFEIPQLRTTGDAPPVTPSTAAPLSGEGYGTNDLAELVVDLLAATQLVPDDKPALVRGRAKPGRIESELVNDRGDGRRGSTSQPGQGKRAVTQVDIVEDLGGYTLVECRLETGRTHQVRIHLAEQGTPLCGEKIYDRPLHGKPLPDHSGARRPALHAAILGFLHPATGKRMQWRSELPRELKDLVNRLRKRRGQMEA